MFKLQSIVNMKIEYAINSNSLELGSFNDIPDNAYMSKISTTCIFNDNGNEVKKEESIKFFVGMSFPIEILSRLIDSPTDYITVNNHKMLKETIKDYNQKNIKRLVLTEFGIEPLDSKDRVFSTNENMKKAISEINNKIETINNSNKNIKVLVKK